MKPSPADLNNITLPELRRHISELRRFDLANATQAQVDRRMAAIINQFPILEEDLRLDRALRVRKNEPGEIFTRKSEVWYPPASRARIGRLGDAGESVFYCAESVQTALFEIDAVPGQTVTLVHCLSKTRPYAKLPSVFIGVSQSRSPLLDKAGYFSRRAYLEEKLGPSQFRKYEVIDRFLCESMTQSVSVDEEIRYRLSIALGHLIFGSPIKLLNYPSVKSGFQGLNLAMPGTVADEHFRAYEAWMLRLGDKEEVGGKLSTPVAPVRRSYPIDDDDMIVWKDEGDDLDGFATIMRPPVVDGFSKLICTRP